MLAPVGVLEVAGLRADTVLTSAVDRGTVAVDGERELEFGPRTPVTVRLTASGPIVLDVRAVLASAAERRLLVRAAEPAREGVGR